MDFSEYFGQKRKNQSSHQTDKTTEGIKTEERNTEERNTEGRKTDLGNLFVSDRPKVNPGAIVVTDLLEDVTERELQTLFERFGSIQRIYVPRKAVKAGGTKEWVGNGTAYITFWDANDANSALSLHGTPWKYSCIKVYRTELN